MSKTTTLCRLQELEGGLLSRVDRVAAEKDRAGCIEKLRRIRQEVGALIQHLTDHEKRKFIPSRKALKAIYNVVDGCIQGIASKDMGRPELKQSLNVLQTRFYPALCSSISEEVEREAMDSPALSEDQRELVEELAESAGATEAFKALKKAASPIGSSGETASQAQLRELSASRKLLPSTLKSEFMVVKMPVVPIFSNLKMNSGATFERAGIPHLLLEGYSVCLNQAILCISARRAAELEMSELEMAQAVLEVLNQRSSGAEYDVVSEHSVANPRNAAIKLFWIMSKPKLAALSRQAMMGRKAATLKWGFPFA